MGNNLREITNVDRVLHEPSRLIIAAILYTVETADFIYLLHETGLTKGNLSVHLTRLEEAGYIKIKKTYRGKVPQTLCSMTEKGRTAFRNYRTHLKQAIESMPD